MSDPFKYFGISPDASKSVLDDAYNLMREQYKFDENTDSVTKDIIENKLLEIDEAYGHALMLISASKKENNQENSTNSNDKRLHFDNNYYNINSLINTKDFSRAEQMILEYNLNGYAKWHYVLARLRFSQGWMNDALENYRKAYELEPYNQVYKQSYENICNMRDGNIKNHKNTVALAITIGVGSLCVCCYVLPAIMANDNGCCYEFFNELGCISVCCDPVETGCKAYCISLSYECCGGCRNG